MTWQQGWMQGSGGGVKRESYLNPRHLTPSKRGNHSLLPSGYASPLRAMGGQVSVLFRRSTGLGPPLLFPEADVLLPVCNRTGHSPYVAFCLFSANLTEVLEQAGLIYQPATLLAFLCPPIILPGIPGSSLIPMFLVLS